jgi:hypothetical protein
MVRRTLVLLAAVALAGWTIAPALARTGSRARLTLSRTHGLTVHGSGFHRHERVRLVLHAASRQFVRRVSATRTGTFSASFPSSAGTGGPCNSVSVTATGVLGSRAVVAGRMAPECIAY